ncbi:MAG: protein kinase family protein [Legionellales bacterium]|nr:protein kinase family protein [Legionellales bacterium]
MPNIKLIYNRQKYSFVIDPNQIFSRPGLNLSFKINDEALGEGGFGAVFSTSDPTLNQENNFLIKISLGDYQNPYAVKTTIQKEISFWQQYDPNFMNNYASLCENPLQIIVKQQNQSFYNHAYGFIIPYYKKTIPLDKFLLDNYNALTEAKIIKLLLAIVSEYKKLHFFHNDFYPRNILVTCENDNYAIKIIDFGLSQSYDDQHQDYTDIQKFLSNIYARRDLEFTDNLLCFFAYYLSLNSFQVDSMISDLEFMLKVRDQAILPGHIILDKNTIKDHPALKKADISYQLRKIGKFFNLKKEEVLNIAPESEPEKIEILYLIAKKFRNLIVKLPANKIDEIIARYKNLYNFHYLSNILSSTLNNKFQLFYTYCRRKIICCRHKDLGDFKVDTADIYPGYGVINFFKTLKNHVNPSEILLGFFQLLLEKLPDSEFHMDYILITHDPFAVSVIDFNYALPNIGFYHSMRILIEQLKSMVTSNGITLSTSINRFMELFLDGFYYPVNLNDIKTILASVRQAGNEDERIQVLAHAHEKFNQTSIPYFIAYYYEINLRPLFIDANEPNANNNATLFIESKEHAIKEFSGSMLHTDRKNVICFLILFSQILNEKILTDKINTLDRQQKLDRFNFFHDYLPKLLALPQDPWYSPFTIVQGQPNSIRIRKLISFCLIDYFDQMKALHNMGCDLFNMTLDTFKDNLDTINRSQMSVSNKESAIFAIINIQPIWVICQYYQQFFCRKRSSESYSCLFSSRNSIEFENNTTQSLFDFYSQTENTRKMDYYDGLITAHNLMGVDRATAILYQTLSDKIHANLQTSLSCWPGK